MIRGWSFKDDSDRLHWHESYSDVIELKLLVMLMAITKIIKKIMDL